MVRGVRCFAALSMTRGCAVAGATTTNRHVILNGVKNLFLTDGRMRDASHPSASPREAQHDMELHSGRGSPDEPSCHSERSEESAFI